MTPMPLALGVQYSQAPIVLAGAVAVLDVATLATDLFGPAMLADRGLNLGRDQRTVAEALSRQLETADLLLTVGESAEAEALLDHIAGRTARCDLYSLDTAAALRRRRPPRLATRGDLRLAEPTGAPGRDGVWTLDLVSPAPLHPRRLLDHLAELSTGRIRGRGYFWVPQTPEVQYGWDNAGGRVLFDVLDHWADLPHTRLVITGTDDSAPRLLAAFHAALVTDDERAAGRWAPLPEALSRRLGTRRYPCAAGLVDESD
jgi:G3E family GTPase